MQKTFQISRSFSFVSIFLLTTCSQALASDIRDAVVKLFITSNSMDYYHPWQTQGSYMKTGSGCIIKGNRILTNAHVVKDQTFIQVRKNSDPKKYTAKVEAIGYECDLALITVEDPQFFEGIDPVEMGELTQLQDTVTVIGYPQGGDKISITEGVVSRIEITAYTLSGRNLLTVQIDAAINPGNSGGPVIKDGKLVGIAMQAIASSQNIGYMIPMPIIQHFFDDLQDNTFDGFPSLGIEITQTENATLRKFYQINEVEGGVLITKILPFFPASKLLKEGDIILTIDNIPIAQDGTFAFRDQERLALSHLISKKQINEKIKISYMRQGRKKETDIILTPAQPLVPYPNYFKKPPYYIFGGFIFTVLSMDLLQTWGSDWWEKSPFDFLYYHGGTGRLNKERRKELVVLLEVLPDDVNVGYHGFHNIIVDKVNGKDIKSFKDFVSIIENINEEYIVIETERNIKFILDSKKIQEANPTILKRNNIPYPFSEDVGQWRRKERTQNEIP